MDIYISPHFDDVIFSLGIELLKNKNKKLIITVFTEEDELLLSKLNGYMYNYGNYKVRKQEDIKVINEIYNADYLHLGFKEELFRKNDINIREKINRKILNIIDKHKINNIYIPLGVGRHKDHLIVYESLNKINFNNKYFYYEFPYSQIDLNRKVRNIELNIKPEFIYITDFINFYYAPIYMSCNPLLRILLIFKNLLLYFFYLLINFTNVKKNYQIYINKKSINKLYLIEFYSTQIKPIFGNRDNLIELLNLSREIILKIKI